MTKLRELFLFDIPEVFFMISHLSVDSRVETNILIVTL